MKHVFLSFLFFILILSGCRSQEKNRPVAVDDRTKNAGKAIQPISAPPVLAGFNFRYAAKKATPVVVHIKSSLPYSIERNVPDFLRDFFDEEFLNRYFGRKDTTPHLQVASASGVIISNDGYIVTNNHVVQGARKVEVVLHDQRNYLAKIIGTDPATDLALLKIEEKALSFIEFGNSDSVEVGDVVLAVGNPFNLSSTVTAGIVSAKARNINMITDQAAVESYIQTDAAVNPGNSGGALVDINGKLIGIVAAIASPTGAYAGYSFAIPVDIVKKITDDLLQFGKINRGYLGIMISDMNNIKAQALGIEFTTGVLVECLQQNGAAIKAGLQKNDIIIKIDGKAVEMPTQLQEIVARHRPGEQLMLTVIRAGKQKNIPVTLMGRD